MVAPQDPTAHAKAVQVGWESMAEPLDFRFHVAEAPWSVAEWAVALRFDIPRATILVLSLSDTPHEFWGPKRPKHS